MTLVGVVTRERPVNSLAPFAILGGTALLMGVPFIGPSPMRILPGYALIRQFGGCSNLGLVGLGCFVGLLGEQFSMFSRSNSMALGDLGTKVCVKAYWVLHATGRWFNMMLVSVVSLKGTTAWGLFLIVGSDPRYLFRVSIRVCHRPWYVTESVTAKMARLAKARRWSKR